MKWKWDAAARCYYKRLPHTSDGGVATSTEEHIRRQNSGRFETGATGCRAVPATESSENNALK